MRDLNPPNLPTTLHRVRNPSAPSSEEVWQSLRDYRAGIPERQKRWRQAASASQETLAQAEQHEPSSRDTYAYGKMSATGPTFITKIQAAPDTDVWEKPNYKAEDMQYFDAKYHDRAEVDAAVSRLCNPSLQAEVCRYRAT